LTELLDPDAMARFVRESLQQSMWSGRPCAHI
jgi:hypothetical protein